MSIFTEKLIISVSYRDLEDFIQEALPELEDYSFLADQEARNDSVFEFEVGPNEQTNFEDACENFDLTSGLLNLLCHQGKIKAGTYLVDASW
jgi:hypothetical protein